MEETNPDLDALAIMSEDFPAYGFEKIMPWAPKAAGDLHVSDFKQILTYTQADLGKLASPNQNMLDQWTQAVLDSSMADNDDNLPGGCLSTNKGIWSSFPVSCLFTEVPKPYQWNLSAGHVSEPLDEMVKLKAGMFSNLFLAGQYVNKASGMAYNIVLHGKTQDRLRYQRVDTEVHSPPSKMAQYFKPTEGNLYSSRVDAMLIKTYYEPEKYNKLDLQYNRFYSPSGGRSEEFLGDPPICVLGYSRPVDESIVVATLGQHVKYDDRKHIGATLTTRMMVPNRCGLSFGEIVTTNGRQVKHNASTNHGMSGGVGANRANPSLFEFVHIAGERNAQDRLFNRGVSKDDPWLVCALVEMVVPDLALCNQWQAGQKESLVTWVANHKNLLVETELWQGVKKAGFA